MANHRRQSINKSHSIPHLQLSKKSIGVIQSYLHNIKPSIGVGLKILVGSHLFFLLDGQTKGGVGLGTTRWSSNVMKFNNLVFFVFFKVGCNVIENT